MVRMQLNLDQQEPLVISSEKFRVTMEGENLGRQLVTLEDFHTEIPMSQLLHSIKSSINVFINVNGEHFGFTNITHAEVEIDRTRKVLVFNAVILEA